MNVAEAIAHLKKMDYKVTPQKTGRYLVERVGQTYGPYPAYMAAHGYKHSSQEKDYKTARELIRFARCIKNKDGLPTGVNKQLKENTNHSRRMKQRVKLRQDLETAEFEKEKSDRWSYT